MAAVTLSGCSLPAYARWVEPRWLRVDRVTLPLFPSPARRPLRLLHLSDFHLSRVVPLSFIQRAIATGLAERPDMAVVTGDFITRTLDQHEAYTAALRRLSEAMPVFAVLGNHDGGRWAAVRRGYTDTRVVERLLAESGIQLLHNEARRIAHGDQAFWLIGLGDLWAEELVAEKAFHAATNGPTIPRIVLSHNPDSKDRLGHVDWDLMLCGHTHGGQVALPHFGTPMAPVIDHRYVAGLNRWGTRWIYTTRGVGNLKGVRFNCRPEISVLDLVAKDAPP